MRKMLSLTALIGGLVAASAAQADITIGFVTSLSGPGASIGIPYGRGIQAAVEYKSEVNGEKIKLIQLCLLYTSPSPRDRTRSRMPSSA